MSKVLEWGKKFSKVSVILAVAGLVIKPATFSVYADDEDFYLPVDEYSTYSAWQYFENYGYSANESRSYNNVFTGTGSFTTSATITLSTGGGGDYADTYSSVNVIDGNFIQNFEITVETAPATLDITAVRSSNYTANLSATCTSTGSLSSGANTGYACTYQDFEMFTSYDMDNPLSGNLTLLVEPTSATGNGSNYNLRLVSAETGHTEGAFTIQESSSGTYSGAGTFSFNITDPNTNTLQYKLPYITTNNLITTINSNMAFTVPPKKGNNTQEYWVCAFLVPEDAVNFGASPLTYIDGIYDYSTGDLINTSEYEIFGNHINLGGFNLKFIRINSSNQSYKSNFAIKFNSNMPNKIIPLFVGQDYRMSDDMYQYIFGVNRDRDLLENGNTTSQHASEDLYNADTNFSNDRNELIGIENQNMNNMSTALNNISTNNTMINNSNFLNSALWVKDRFEDLTVNTPFELVIVFSLVLGISLTIIGKLRNR